MNPRKSLAIPVMAFVAEKNEESPVRASVAMISGTTIRIIFSRMLTSTM
jgi:hypothetical protein